MATAAFPFNETELHEDACWRFACAFLERALRDLILNKKGARKGACGVAERLRLRLYFSSRLRVSGYRRGTSSGSD